MISSHIELSESQLARLRTGPLFNEDLAPVPASRRKWKAGTFAALWISMSACIPTYTLASGLIGGGMNWWQAVLTIFLGNLIVLIPMLLNAHAGTLYGIPFPVYCRASFGTLGANIPAILRALIACGWFGIQTWIGGAAIFTILAVRWPSIASGGTFLGVNSVQFGCFLFFWAINMFVVYKGIECIRWLLNIKAPLLIALGLLLLAWAYRHAGGFGPMLSQQSKFDAGQPLAGMFWKAFFPALTGVVGFWATLSLNIPDFSRYAHSQRDQVVGQALGLPLTMALYSFIGVAVTSATTVIYGQMIWDPVQVLAKFNNPALLIISSLALCLATLATNIAANVVSPANDFSHLAPQAISFRTGGLITGIIGILIMPWHLYANPDRYINGWLVGYSALLGPIGGILIADYFVWRDRRLNLEALYQADAEYRYTKGFSLIAVMALIAGILPSMPGFLIRIGVLRHESVPLFLANLYDYAWFVGFAIAFVVYLAGRQLSSAAKPEAVGVDLPETANK
jgi:NCS1 family nucleobase:cation symporter-1